MQAVERVVDIDQDLDSEEGVRLAFSSKPPLQNCRFTDTDLTNTNRNEQSLAHG